MKNAEVVRKASIRKESTASSIYSLLKTLEQKRKPDQLPGTDPAGGNGSAQQYRQIPILGVIKPKTTTRIFSATNSRLPKRNTKWATVKGRQPGMVPPQAGIIQGIVPSDAENQRFPLSLPTEQ